MKIETAVVPGVLPGTPCDALASERCTGPESTTMCSTLSAHSIRAVLAVFEAVRACLWRWQSTPRWCRVSTSSYDHPQPPANRTDGRQEEIRESQRERGAEDRAWSSWSQDAKNRVVRHLRTADSVLACYTMVSNSTKLYDSRGFGVVCPAVFSVTLLGCCMQGRCRKKHGGSA